MNDCPSGLSIDERIVWMLEQRRKIAEGETEAPEQPRHVKDPNLPPSEDGQ